MRTWFVAAAVLLLGSAMVAQAYTLRFKDVAGTIVEFVEELVRKGSKPAEG